ncbi:hypothetical protein [Mangrovibacterium diazotrophicum]|uniref:Uncharacterized protein n=1 Tax=Mangrovibacterium diazotrophicum TaxID=1261403 RepID=A0A419VW93_9BACT|nr:hypothetical protein [Mangrovibacterium diazotrophicum]RKD86415.1 hypothetical protein BC643_4106 [Mangrovibacterium diazotrophicum]
MFEELKEKLQKIDEKISHPGANGFTEDDEKVNQLRQSRQVLERILQRISEHLKMIKEDKSASGSTLKQMEIRLEQKLDNFIKAEQQQSKLKIRRRSVIHLLLFLLFFMIVSIAINFYQAERISRLRENIRMHGITQTNQGAKPG